MHSKYLILFFLFIFVSLCGMQNNRRQAQREEPNFYSNFIMCYFMDEETGEIFEGSIRDVHELIKWYAVINGLSEKELSQRKSPFLQVINKRIHS